jgi:ubiquinone/menaquinone biosynthesis C-methylase UbiE
VKRIHGSKYYSNNASLLGWGEKEAKLDSQRIDLLSKFLIGKKVLDVGCGYGVYVDYLSKNGIEVVGIDLVKEFINSATKNKRGEFLQGSADNLPFKNKEFESVYLFDILEHGDDLKILKEAKRVTKRRILIIVPRIVDKRLADSGVIFRHYIDKSHIREYEEKMLKDLAQKAGLKVSYMEKIHPLYNETIFTALFGGNIFLKKALRRIVLLFLSKEKYFTEYFAVFDL